MGSRSSRITFPDHDPVRTYTPEELQLLTANLVQLLTKIHAGAYSTSPIDTRLLCWIHEAIFLGVRDHAGKHRSAHFGAERLSYGPHRSSDRREVAALLRGVFAKLRPSLRSLEENPGDPVFVESAIHVGVWVHAEIIRIHPFEDGNGRTSRALMNVLLVRLGLPAAAIEVPKQEYLECLNHWYLTHDLRPLVDLVLRCLAA